MTNDDLAVEPFCDNLISSDSLRNESKSLFTAGLFASTAEFLTGFIVGLAGIVRQSSSPSELTLVPADREWLEASPLSECVWLIVFSKSIRLVQLSGNVGGRVGGYTCGR